MSLNQNFAPLSPTRMLSTWLSNMKSDDIEGGLAADFDGSLSGLGVELGSAPYNMRFATSVALIFLNSIQLRDVRFKLTKLFFTSF